MLFLPSKKISPFTEWWKGRECFNVAWRQMSASQKRLISTVSGTQAREQPLAPEKFSAGSFASVTFRATSGVKCLGPCCAPRHRNLCLYCGGKCLWLYRVQYWMWPVPCGHPWAIAAIDSLFRWQILLHRGCALEAFWLHHLWSDLSPSLLS